MCIKVYCIHEKAKKGVSTVFIMLVAQGFEG